MSRVVNLLFRNLVYENECKTMEFGGNGKVVYFEIHRSVVAEERISCEVW